MQKEIVFKSTSLQSFQAQTTEAPGLHFVHVGNTEY